MFAILLMQNKVKTGEYGWWGVWANVNLSAYKISKKRAGMANNQTRRGALSGHQGVIEQIDQQQQGVAGQLREGNDVGDHIRQRMIFRRQGEDEEALRPRL